MEKKQDVLDLMEGALKIAREAGDAIAEIYHRNQTEVSYKPDASPLTEADLASHHIIEAGLAELSPEIPLLSEEATILPYASRQSCQRLWLVDPLDGTREFLKRNGEFTVNIALLQDNRPILGVVHAPILSRTYIAATGHGAWRVDMENQRRRRIHANGTSDEELAVVASRSHTGTHLKVFLEALSQHRLVSMGSSLKLCLVAEGEADLYPRLSPTMEWDTAAAQAVVTAAGGQVLDMNQRPLRYNKKDLFNPYFIVLGTRSVPWNEAWATVARKFPQT